MNGTKEGNASLRETVDVVVSNLCWLAEQMQEGRKARYVTDGDGEDSVLIEDAIWGEAGRLETALDTSPQREDGLLAQESLLVSNCQSPNEGHRCEVYVNPEPEDWDIYGPSAPVAVAWADDPGVATAVALRRADEDLKGHE